MNKESLDSGMLLHLVPKIYNPYSNVSVSLVDVKIPELDVVLKNDVELTARRPYPNKCYLVACKKIGRKAVNGIYIIASEHLESFTVITRWSVDAERILTHVVKYTVSEQDFGAMTDKHVNLLGTCESLGGYGPRGSLDEAPVDTQPRMDILFNNKGHSRGINLFDDYENGFLVKREEVITIPTVEVERLTESLLDDRLPDLDHGFRYSVLVRQI